MTPQPDGRRWGPMVPLGANLQLRSAEGSRAAVVPLKPGLFIVAEIPEHLTRPDFGFLPLLAPLVIKAAAKAIRTPPEQRVLPKLLATAASRDPNASALSTVKALAKTLTTSVLPAKTVNASASALVPAAAISATPTLPATPTLTPAQHLLPPPAIGAWVDAEDLAGLIGCAACKGRCER